MGYCFKRKESVSEAIRRLGTERIAHGLHCLRRAGHAAAIHAVRKDIKKLRAVLRLLRAALQRKDFRGVIRTLKNAARLLAAPRDAYIKAQALRQLAGHFRKQLTPAAIRHVRAHVRRICAEETTRFAQKDLPREIERTLRRANREWARLQLCHKGWHAVGPGLKCAYRRAERAYQDARCDPSPAQLHTWRKRAKDLWYDVRLLQPVWSEPMKTLADELDALGEILGEDHDLTVLQAEIEHSHLPRMHAAEVDLLAGLIAQRREELRIAAFTLGQRLFIEKPSVFSSRMGEYWHAWRRN